MIGTHDQLDNLTMIPCQSTTFPKSLNYQGSGSNYVYQTNKNTLTRKQSHTNILMLNGLWECFQKKKIKYKHRQLGLQDIN